MAVRVSESILACSLKMFCRRPWGFLLVGLVAMCAARKVENGVMLLDVMYFVSDSNSWMASVLCFLANLYLYQLTVSLLSWLMSCMLVCSARRFCSSAVSSIM